MQILQTIPANTVALEGAVYNGTSFFTDRGDGQPIHPFTTQRTKQGSVLWPQFAPPRIGNTAKAKGARRSINTGDAELWLECEVAGTTAASAPVINYSQIGTTVVDGTVTWRVKGLHAFKGFANWPARTNTWLDSDLATPTSLHTRVIDSTPDPFGVQSSALYTLDTAAGGRIFMDDTSGVNTTFSSAVYVKAAPGSTATQAWIEVCDRVSDTIRATSETISLTNNWKRIQANGGTTAGATAGARIQVRFNSTGASAKVYVACAQLEAASFASPYIATTTATVTRAATNLSLPTAGIIRENDFGVDIWVIPGASQTAVPFAVYTDANNEYSVNVAPTTATARKRIAGVNNDAVATSTHVAATPMRVQMYFSSSAGVGIRVRQLGGSFMAWATNATTTALTPAAAMQIGAVNNGSHMGGNYPATRFVLHSDPKAELERLAAIDDAWVAGQI